MSIKSEKFQFTCLNCRANFDDACSQRSHFKTEWHMYNLKRKVCKLPSISQDDFEKIHALPISENEKDSINKPVLSIEVEEDPDSDWSDEDSSLDEEEEVAELLARVVPERNCLFCNKKSNDIKANINHMNLVHGFFIPEEQYLIDCEGLLKYLGFKVGAGATCLWCNKQFSTLHGVRLHMLYKDHCKIRYDQDKAVEEFKDFYDYSDQVQIPMKDPRDLAIPKKRSERRTDYRVVPSNQSKQLMVRKNPAIIAGTYQSKNIKKFSAQRAKRLLHIGMTNNQAVRGRLRRQNPM